MLRPAFTLPRPRAFAWLWAAPLVAVLASPAPAVVITSSSDAVNLVAPGNDPGWLNVGRVAGASGVYLGNRWVITANHVSRGALRLTDGREFAVSIGSDVLLDNPPGSFGRPDLRMFRLAEDPGLPSLTIAESMPPVHSQVLLIGAGADRSVRLTGWQIGFPWTEVPLPAANAFGYKQESTSQMRWGMNRVASETTRRSDGTLAFSTRFDQRGIPYEAQGTSGDSGGGAFRFDDGWHLAGIIVSTQQLANQPEDAIVFGNQTFLADLAEYAGQIQDFLSRPEPLWQNQVNHFDVGGTGRAEARDVLLIANELLGVGTHDLAGAPGASDWFFDVNGDLRVSPSDINVLVNNLLGGSANPLSSPAAGMTFVPEPTTAALAIVGSLITLLAACRARRRRRVL